MLHLMDSQLAALPMNPPPASVPMNPQTVSLSVGELEPRQQPPAKRPRIRPPKAAPPPKMTAPPIPTTPHPAETSSEGLLNEKVLYLIFRHLNWNPFLLGRTACVCKKLSAIAKRLLWKEFCITRAPRMVNDLIAGGRSDTMYGGWDTLAKLMVYCGGCQPTTNFRVACRIEGHFVQKSRFSKTSGRSFLPGPCRSDILYITDPCCEHGLGPEEDEVGIFRGIFRGFQSSRTMQCLMLRGAQYERDKLCPYCKAKVWSMTSSRMIPRSASRRLAAYDGNLEYFVCVNGHLHGKCLLVPLSDSDEFDDDDELT